MPEFRRTVLTNKGRELLSQAQTGTEIKFSRIECGDGKRSTNLESMTKLTHSVHAYEIQGFHNDGDQFTVWTTVGSKDNPTGFYLREEGLFAVNPLTPDNRDNDILYAVSVVVPTDAHDYMVFVPQDGSDSSIGWRLEIHVIIAGATNVTVIINNSGDYALLDELEKYTPLSMFKPVPHGLEIYGGHRHVMDDIDGLLDFLNYLDMRLNMLNELINQTLPGGIEFRMTFWTLDGITVNDGVWQPDYGRMIA